MGRGSGGAKDPHLLIPRLGRDLGISYAEAKALGYEEALCANVRYARVALDTAPSGA